MTSSHTDTCSAQTAALFALMCLAAQTVAAEPDRCDGAVLQLAIKSGTNPVPSTVYGVLAAFGGIPSFNLSQPTQLVAANPLNACEPLPDVQGAMVLAERGNCSYIDKYKAVIASGAVGMILYDNVPGCVSMGGSLTNSSSPESRNSSQPAAISIDREDGLNLYSQLQSGINVTVQYELLDIPAFNASALLLLIMAVGTVIVGSLWSEPDYAFVIRGSSSGSRQQSSNVHSAHDNDARLDILELTTAGAVRGSSSGSRQQSSNVHSAHDNDARLDILELTTAGAVGFVAFISLVLMVLFFFGQVLFYIILVAFCMAGAHALCSMLIKLLRMIVPRIAYRDVRLPFDWGIVCAGDVIAAPVAIAVTVAVVWVVGRHTSWSWILQDMLGIAMMVLTLRTLRLPNLKVACVLLPLFFCYDVFWVFLQPMIVGDGKSVMIQVVDGAGSHESLPMLLRLPNFSGPPIIRGTYGVLGFGDVILPGLLVALTRRLDIAGKSTWHGGYFVASVMGYGAGLLLTYVALIFSWFGDQGQPALLYLVPSTLGVVLVLAAVRGELRQLFEHSKDSRSNNSPEDGVVAGSIVQYQAVVNADDDCPGLINGDSSKPQQLHQHSGCSSQEAPPGSA